MHPVSTARSGADLPFPLGISDRSVLSQIALTCSAVEVWIGAEIGQEACKIIMQIVRKSVFM